MKGYMAKKRLDNKLADVRARLKPLNPKIDTEENRELQSELKSIAKAQKGVS